MTFLYLTLEYKTREESGNRIFGEGLWATVRSDGHMPRSIGESNSRWCNSPLAVFQLAGFSGIDVLDDDQLMEELLRRMTPAQIVEHLKHEFTAEQLGAWLAERLADCDRWHRDRSQ